MEPLDVSLSPFSAWVLKTTLQGSLLVCLIVLVKLVLRNRLPAKWHFALWLVLLVRLSLPWAPQSRLSIYNAFQPRHWAPGIRNVHPQPEQSAAGLGEKGQKQTAATTTDAEVEETPAPAPVPPQRATGPEPASVASPLAQGPESRGGGVRRWFVRMGPVLSLLWLAGAVLLGGCVLARSLWLWRAVKAERPVTDQQILDLLEDCKMQMGVQTILGVVVTDRVKSPALFGFVRPRLLLPQGLLEGLSLDELQHVFLHELAHLRRGDIYIGWWTAVLQVLHWFNPLIWFAFRQMRADQEMACDGLALSRMTAEEPRAYGRTIVCLLERFSQPHYVPSVAGILEEPSNIERRMTMIARFRHDSYRWSPLPLLVIVALGCTSLTDMKRSEAESAAAPKFEPATTLRELPYTWGGFASLSPDGRYMCDVDWDTESLVVRELATGKARPLTATASGETGCPLESAISPDSSKVAYQWWDSTSQTSSLCSVGLDGSGRRLLRRGRYLIPKGWSADGQKILTVASENDTQRMIWVSASDGSIQDIASVRLGYPGKLDISPDGRLIAYDRPEADDASERDFASKRDLFVFDPSEDREVPLVKHPADDRLLGWTPDGRSIFFASDRTGTWAAWLLRVAGDKAQGFPELVKEGIGGVRAVGFAPSGSYYYHSQQTLWDVCIASLNMETGEVLSEPMPVRQTGATIYHDWSPDGLYQAYCTRRPNEPQVIHIRTLATGEERMLASDLPHFNNLRWSLDGRSILASHFEADTPQIICRVDVQTGKRTTLLSSETERLRRAELSRDGKLLFYICDNLTARTSRLVARTLESGREEDLFRTAPPAQGLVSSLSPDGQRFVLSMLERRRPSRVPILKILSVGGGVPRELIRFDESEKLRAVGVTWMPDSRDVLFWKCFQGRKELELWKIPAAGGEPRELWSRRSLGRLRVHPDGERIAFNNHSTKRGVWIMENFLPEAVGSAGK